MSHPAPARRRTAPALGALALALALTGCGGGGESTPSSSAPAVPAAGPSTPGVAATATGDPESPASQAAAQIREARASERAEGSDRPQPREALETVGPGVQAGAASRGWQSVASSRNDSVAVMDCTQDVLEQATLDAVDAWLASSDANPAAQRYVREGRADIARALAAQARDAG